MTEIITIILLALAVIGIIAAIRKIIFVVFIEDKTNRAIRHAKIENKIKYGERDTEFAKCAKKAKLYDKMTK